MRKIVDKIIDDVEYKIKQMSGFKALKIQTRLIKVLGSTIGELEIDLEKPQILEKNILEKGLSTILKNFDDKLIYQLVIDVLSEGIFIQKIDTKGTPFLDKLDLNEFSFNDPRSIWKLFYAVLDVNFTLGKFIKFPGNTSDKDKDKDKDTKKLDS